jgi:hypothetical protein
MEALIAMYCGHCCACKLHFCGLVKYYWEATLTVSLLKLTMSSTSSEPLIVRQLSNLFEHSGDVGTRGKMVFLLLPEIFSCP